MEIRIKEVITELCLPLQKIPCVVGIFIYGSSIKKLEKGHDIDILVLFNEEKAERDDIQKLDLFIDLITEKAKKQDLILHFQPPKSLSLWWKLISKAEPWAISAIRKSIIIYDPVDYLKLIKDLVAKGELYSIDEKAERLMARAIERLFEVRERLLKAAYELLQAMTIASQIMLSYLNVYTTSATETKKALEKYKDKLGLKDKFIQDFDDLLKMNIKIYKGTLSEFGAAEIDAWRKRIHEYIKESENILLKLEEENRQKELKEAYEYLLALCTRALATKIKKLPTSDKEKIELFKKLFVDTKKIEPIHYETLKEVYMYIKEKKPVAKHVDKVYIKTLEASINELIASRKR